MISNEMLNDYENDIDELFEDAGDTYMEVFQYSAPSSPSVYKEQKFKTYVKSHQIIGRIRLSPTAEEISAIGRSKECNAIITFTGKRLKNMGVVYYDDSGKEHCQITLDSVIRYNGEYYNVRNIVPFGMIADRFLLYKFECFHITDTSKMTFTEDTDDGKTDGTVADGGSEG